MPEQMNDMVTRYRLPYDVQRNRCLSAVKKMKEFLLDAPQQIDTERLRFLLDTYQEYGSEPVILLRARLFEKVLQNKTIYIDDNPIVGTVTSKPAGVYVYPEWDADWIIKEMNQTMMSHLGKVNISEEDKALMKEAGRYFKTRSATYRARTISKELTGYDPRLDIKAGLFTEGTMYALGAGNVDYSTYVHRGLLSIIEETENRLRSLEVTTENSQKIDFYRAALISMHAVIALANRYADLAEKMASETDDNLRKAELLDIADICRNVPANPPKDFRESIQSWWFLHVCIQIEQAACGSSPGRIGQYLNDFYMKDVAENGLTAEDAKAWLKCLFVKILEYGYYQGLAFFELVSGHTGHTINIGGLDADGNDATSELDYLILDTQIDLRNIQPTITLLYHDKLKEDFLMKAIELERTGLGQPQWMNTHVIIERLLTRHAANGITIQDARNCINMSCVGTGVAGKTAFIRENSTYNLAKCFELAMNNGIDPTTKKQIGPKTGDPITFTTFEELFQAYHIQVADMFRKIRHYGSISNKCLGDTVPGPWRSSMYHGCLERGKTEYQGGTDYYLYYTISTAGIDAANSLGAVRALVFDEKKITMSQLVDALNKNFEDCEEIREMCINAPKHGNNLSSMNALVRRVYDDAWESYHSNGSSYFGKHIGNPEAYSLSIHNYFGMLTGALPTGRKKGLPLTDASVSAAPGTDKNGPIALITSAAQALDTVKYGSNHFNMKFQPNAISGVAGARKLLALIKQYMDMGGCHIQFNIVSSETLKQAQMKPEDYKSLTVRVAGFSAYFTRLHEGVQNEIIARTELTL